MVIFIFFRYYKWEAFINTLYSYSEIEERKIQAKELFKHNIHLLIYIEWMNQWQ